MGWQEGAVGCRGRDRTAWPPQPQAQGRDTQPGRAGTNLSQVLTSAVSTPECGRLRVPKETFLKVPLLTFSDQKLMHIHIENSGSTKKA